jgi:hypothetical protein
LNFLLRLHLYIGFWGKTLILFDKNWQKSQKILIITHYVILHFNVLL